MTRFGDRFVSAFIVGFCFALSGLLLFVSISENNASAFAFALVSIWLTRLSAKLNKEINERLDK